MTNLALSKASELDRYIGEVNQYPVLDREEEQRLARRYRDEGDVAAAHTLVVSNLRFVVKIAHGYKGYGLKLLDLIQEGNIGLMHAVKKFDPDRGYRLISYAVWWIRAQIQSYIMRSWSLVKMGSGRVRRKLFFKLRSERSELEREAAGDGSDTRAALAERLGVDVGDVAEMELRLGARDFSLDAPLTDDEPGASHLDMVEANIISAEEDVVQREEKDLLRKVISRGAEHLNEKEAYILEHRLLSEDPPTLAEIGEHFGVSRERIRQLENRVITKLRKTASDMNVAA